MTNWQRHYISLIKNVTSPSVTKLKLDNANRQGNIIIQSATDDRQCRSINSFSNMSNSRRFCLDLLVTVSRFHFSFFYTGKKNLVKFSLSHQSPSRLVTSISSNFLLLQLWAATKFLPLRLKILDKLICRKNRNVKKRHFFRSCPCKFWTKYNKYSATIAFLLTSF